MRADKSPDIGHGSSGLKALISVIAPRLVRHPLAHRQNHLAAYMRLGCTIQFASVALMGGQPTNALFGALNSK